MIIIVIIIIGFKLWEKLLSLFLITAVITGDNPVLGEALIESLQTASALISQMEDPVAAFLSSDEYTSAAPQDQEVYII